MERNSIFDKQENANCVYLVPGSDGTWSAVVSADNPVSSGALLTPEGPYPVDLYYSRLDMNGSSNLERETFKDREALLEALNWIGQCCHFPKALWEFDADKSLSSELIDIFNASYSHRMNQIKEDLAELDAPSADSPVSGSDKHKTSLSDQIHKATNRTSSSQVDTAGHQKETEPER